MSETRYKVYMNDEIVAQDVDIKIATILARALFEESYNESSMTVSIKRMERVEVCCVNR